jgi:iron complex transport system permease protein
VLVAAAALTALVAAAGLFAGSRDVPAADVWTALIAPGDTLSDDALIVRLVRVPRAVLGLVVGVCLGVAGTLMQGLTRNPLAEPGILGVNAGAGAAVVAAMVWLDARQPIAHLGAAFLGAGIATILVYLLGGLGRRRGDPIRLVLAGAGLGVVFAALTRVLLLSAPQDVYDSYRVWATGSLQGRGWDVVAVTAAVAGLGLAVAWLLAPQLNAVSLGDELGRALGVNRALVWGIAGAALFALAGAATAAAGPIAFIGLAAPNVARLLVGPDHRWLVPTAAVAAALLVTAADVVGRVIAPPGEVEVGVMAAFLGAPVFIALVRRRRRAVL